jgi:membrane protease YdiL (CAAX protease family)
VENYGLSLPIFILEVTALSVAFAWLYGNTDGSLLPVVLMHSAVNQVFAVLPTPRRPANPLAFSAELTPWLVVAFAWIMAAYFLSRMPTAATDEMETESSVVDH